MQQMRMRMCRRHNSGMQLLVCAVYIINATLHYDLYKLAGFALSHSPVDNYRIAENLRE